MIYSVTLQKEIEKWWKNLEKVMAVENIKGHIVYPILDVYIDICKGRKYTSYKKVRCHCYC